MEKRENLKYNFSKLVEDISRVVPLGTVLYAKVCFLLTAILPPSAPKPPLNGSKLLSQIYHETLEDRRGGCATFWYVLNEAYGIPDDLLVRLRKYVTEDCIIPKDIAPRVHLRTMILKVVSGIAKKKDQAIGIINTAGSALEPQVRLEALPKPGEDNDYTVPLLMFFETAEQQCAVSDKDLSRLRQWLNDCGCRWLIQYLDSFDPKKEIKIRSTFVSQCSEGKYT